MYTNWDICHICLRTDIKVEVFYIKLFNFYRELCGVSIKDANPQYCYECKHLLKKMYNFKIKCRKAMEILENWINTEAVGRSPITNLYKHMPTTLACSISSSLKIYTYKQEEDAIVCTSKEGSNISLDPITKVVCDAQRVNESNTIQDLLESSLPLYDIKVEKNSNDSEVISPRDFLVPKNENSKALFEEIVHTGSVGDVKINDVDSNYSETNNDDGEIFNEWNYSSDENETLLAVMKNEIKRKESRKTIKELKKFGSKVDVKNTRRRRSAVNKERIKAKNNTGDKQNIPKNIVIKEYSNKKNRLHTRKNIIAELTNDLDKLENGLKRKRLKNPYNKERLIAELQSKFSSCGEIEAADGTVIDKQFILQCLDDKASDFLMKQLYQAVYGKLRFQPKALKLFKCIQNRYKTEYESVFDIEYLNTKEKMIEEFENRQSYPSYIIANFKCDICFQGFKHEKKLQYHLKCHDKSTGDRECFICKMRFRTEKSLINHMSTHEAVYKCKQCPLVTYYKTCMKNHYEQHNGKQYKCEECSSTFQSVSAYRTHVSYRHSRSHVCTTCGRAFNTSVGLRAHCTKRHQNETLISDGDTTSSVKCEECSVTLVSWEAYQTHLRVTHKRREQKGRPLGSISTRARKPGVQRKRPVMTCRVCNMVGNSVGWLQLHFTENHPSVDMVQMYADKHTHLCDICGKSFSTVYTLQAHLNIHAGVRPYACEVCSARFHRSISLRLHKLVHKPPSKPCSRCGKKFRSTSNLNNHMRSHIGDRRYKCNICGKGFIHRNSVNEHVRGVHKNIRRVRKRGVTDAVRNHTIDIDREAGA